MLRQHRPPNVKIPEQSTRCCWHSSICLLLKTRRIHTFTRVLPFEVNESLISIFDTRSWFRVVHARSPSLLGVSLYCNLVHTLLIAEKLRSTEAVLVAMVFFKLTSLIKSGDLFLLIDRPFWKSFVAGNSSSLRIDLFIPR